MPVHITSLSHEGRGITQIDHKTVFVENALPEELVEIEIFKKHSRYNEARAIEILVASPDRVMPKCPHADICAGCQLQHISPDAQLALKQKTLLEQLLHQARAVPVEILPPLKSPAWGYRHKGRLSVKYVDKKQKLLIGFHEKNGRFVADLTRCEVLHPKIGLSIEPLRQLILSLSIFKALPQIEIACDNDHCALLLRCLEKPSQQDIDLIRLFAEKNNFIILIEPNKPEQIKQLYPITDSAYFLSYHFKNIKFKFHPKDFTQINPAINQQMIALALRLLDLNPADSVLDLFCGLGNFTLPIAAHCAQVTGIEGDSNMVLRAQHNAEQNHILNAEFYAANLFEPEKIKQAAWIQRKYNKILLDPPRTGAIEILPYIQQWRPDLIIYVSCNPATLARDAAILISYGYQLNKAGIMDMFPHTKHIESIAVFMHIK